MDYPDPEIPPISRIAGVDLTTEGVVTISRVLKSVSYTHLDVYKRQAYTCRRA